MSGSFAIPFSGFTAPLPYLELAAYLTQVRESHQGYQAAIDKAEGTMKRAVEYKFLTAPSLFANSDYAIDERPTQSSAFSGNKTKTWNGSVGLTKDSRYGLASTFSYDIRQSSLNGVDPLLVPDSDYYNNSAAIELSQSLWKNAKGKRVRSEESLTESQALANSQQERQRAVSLLSEAEKAYWTISLYRRLKVVQSESLKRAVELRDWNERRVKSGLADPTDLLQAQASLKLRELDLKTTVDLERSAARQFNSLRGMDSDTVGESLFFPSDEEMKMYPIPDKEGPSHDLLAAEKRMQAAVAGGSIAKEDRRPTLDLYGRLAFHGKDNSFSTASSDTFGGDHPEQMVGLRFVFPLDIGTTHEVLSGYEQEIAGTKQDYERREFDEHNDWNELMRSLADARERFDLDLTVENVQKMKYENERKVQRRGQSTTFQVLQFEQDYLSAQLRRFETQGKILQIVAEMKKIRGVK